MSVSSSDALPNPHGDERRKNAKFIRDNASENAFKRPQPATLGLVPPTQNNGEELQFSQTYSTSFSKGLPRNEWGFVDSCAYMAFVRAINRPTDSNDYFDTTVPLGPCGAIGANDKGKCGSQHNFKVELWDGGKKENTVIPIVRNWESPRSGHSYVLEGPDPDAVCMPPAPRLESDEMAVEMAEVYALSLLRDVPFEQIESGDGKTDYNGITANQIGHAISSMNWFSSTPKSPREMKRRKARYADKFPGTLFRGSTYGCNVGGYISQFMLAGTTSPDEICDYTDEKGDCRGFKPIHGFGVYGTQLIDQRSRVHLPGVDYMVEWQGWMDVQYGIDMKNGKEGPITIDRYRKGRRFISTPRDLATYVHSDQLYQAYLNACLMMLEMKVGFSDGLPTGVKDRDITRGSFATFGGPHVLALLTEVSSRALRAVRRQKFNYHRRCRPEQIGALMTLAASKNAKAKALDWDARAASEAMLAQIPAAIRSAVAAKNDYLLKPSQQRERWVKVSGKEPEWITENLLLPMAFPEGSPMHASYGAGHATVAGACVTVLKAFFQTVEKDWKRTPYPQEVVRVVPESRSGSKATPVNPDKRGEKLEVVELGLTLEGELNKLAANISIGRNMAGVHFYTDYYDSLRMGERIAAGILQEQMLTYVDPVKMRFFDFDGNKVEIEGYGNQPGVANPVVRVEGEGTGCGQDRARWWLCE